MKFNKVIIMGALAAAGMSLTSCNDFLDRNRYPLDTQVDQPLYWDNTVNVENQINGLYSNFTGYGNGTSWVNNFYYRSLSDNQCAEIASGSGVVFCQWKYQYAPENNTVWDANYKVIRKINTIITGVEGSSINEIDKANFIGIARLNRAYQYWDLVRCFGDVPLIEGVLDVNSPELYGKRTNRNTVMDFVLEDLNYAVANITQQSNKIEFSVDMAQAMKSEICLFEASYAKYHQKDNARAEKYFDEVIKACNAVMGSYTLCDDYRSLYNSVWTADAARGFVSLQDNPEVIFMKGYSLGILGHSMIKYLSSNTPIAGMTKDAFDAYLFKDGKPKALTSENTDDAAVLDADGNLSIANALAVRDGRLAQTIDPYLAFAGCMHARENSDPLASNTGYTICKFINPGMTYNENTLDGSNFTCAPLYWLAEIYLNYAEARAERNLLDNNDMKMTLNKLYKRAGLPEQTVESLSGMTDPANNMGVSNLLWEIRRCRRCELMFDNYIRYWDLIRWHQLELLDTTKYPAIAMGANVSNAPADLTASVIVTDGYIDAARNTASTSVRTFTEREYLDPIGTSQLKLNKELTQNPGWGNE